MKNLLIFVLAVAICWLYGYSMGLKSRLNEYANISANIESLEIYAPQIKERQLNKFEIEQVKNQQQIIRNIISKEGIYSNDTHDKGGETVYGLARNFNPNLKIWKEVDKLKKRGGSMIQKIKTSPHIKSMAEAEYLNQFRKHGLDKIDLVVADLIFDGFVNTGFGAGSIMIQKLCNGFNYQHKYGADLSVDGNFGKGSRERLIQVVKDNKEQFIHALLGMRHSHYVNIASSAPTQRKFLRGWLNRIN